MTPHESDSAAGDRAGAGETARRCSALAKEILSYMARNPNAQDTLEGIVEWWLLEHRIRSRTALVRGALDELVELGLVTRTGSRGPTRYRIDPRSRDEIRALCRDPESEP